MCKPRKPTLKERAEHHAAMAEFYAQVAKESREEYERYFKPRAASGQRFDTRGQNKIWIDLAVLD